MKILVAHNAYHYRGGEDTLVEAELALLTRQGHEVVLYRRDNVELARISPLRAARDAIWSPRTVAELHQLSRHFKPDLIHAHNIFPLISPSLYDAARKHRIPVVQTLHNFRLLCPQAMLVRDGRVCTDCVGRWPWRAVLHRCYRGSFAQTAVTAGMLAVHRLRGSWNEGVSRYIVLNRSCRDLFIAGGLPAEKLRIKPNFVEASDVPEWGHRIGGVFIGRLSPEKGLTTLAQALQSMPGKSIDVYGTGPLQALVERTPGLRYRGFLDNAPLRQRMLRAAYLVMPSTGMESFGLAAIEAFACGVPVIASRQGGLQELITDRQNGLLVTPGDPGALAEAIAYADAHPQDMRRMGMDAYQTWRAHYTPERNYEMLMHIYDEALSFFPSHSPEASQATRSSPKHSHASACTHPTSAHTPATDTAHAKNRPGRE